MRRCSETAWKSIPRWKRAFKIPVGLENKFNGLEYVFSFLFVEGVGSEQRVRVAVGIRKSPFCFETRKGYEAY